MSNKIELSWLAGFMEADGSICIFKHQRENGNWKLSVTITATNNDPCIINEVDRITRNIGVVMHLHEKKQQKPQHATGYNLTLRGFKDCYTLLQHIAPYMKGNKKAIAHLTMRFLHRRMKAIKKDKNMPASDVEHRIQKEVQKRNKTGVPKNLTSETKRDALIREVKI